jgi:hypothetical protein
MTLLRRFLLAFIFFILSALLPTITFAADVCRGYQNGSNKLEEGICYFSLDVSSITPTPGVPIVDYTTDKGINAASTDQIKETCSQMTAADYHKTSAYHAISDSTLHCAPVWLGQSYKCCAPDTQKQLGPPPPCDLDPKTNNCKNVSTGLGNISVDPASIVGSLFSIFLGLSGGIAIILIMITGYRIIFSRNDPEKLKGAREMLTSAIIGLLFIIFSITILRIIGVDILHIPGLSK